MTQDEFLEEFERVHKQFEWKLSPETSPMAERRSKPRLVLRGKPKSGPDTAPLDPVAAVCYAHGGQVYESRDAARVLGMNLPDAAAVVAASNDNTYSGAEGQRKPEHNLITVRERMLETVGEVEVRRSAAGG